MIHVKVRVLRSDRIKTKISSTIKSLLAIRFKKHWIKHVQIFVVLENEMEILLNLLKTIAAPYYL